MLVSSRADEAASDCVFKLAPRCQASVNGLYDIWAAAPQAAVGHQQFGLTA